MSVLVDSSVWIAYFRGISHRNIVDLLIEENLIYTNDLILTELIPALTLNKEKKLIALMREINRQPISIDWDEIIHIQTLCLHNGINGIGIPDIIIAQNSMQGNLQLLSNDKHFNAISKIIPLNLFQII